MLSLITAGSGVKPRYELKPIDGFERVAIAGALVAVFAIHGSGVLWASARLEDVRAFQRMRHERTSVCREASDACLAREAQRRALISRRARRLRGLDRPHPSARPA